MNVHQMCPNCRTAVPVPIDGSWQLIQCRCGYQGYPTRYTITTTTTNNTAMLSGGFPFLSTNTTIGIGIPQPAQELPAWAQPEREAVPDAFQRAFDEGELEP